MAVLPILRWPDPRLATVCAPAVLCDDLNRLAADMLDTMYAAPGRGLAAPQVGVLLRIFVMDVGWKDGNPMPEVVVNPEILWSSPELAEGPEGCLSIPGITTQIIRPRSVTMRWTMLDGTLREETLAGFAAICAQHEYDHLDGIVTFHRLSPEARALAEAEFAG
ncbi:peptide deformylase [Fertoebacter nigrum]|uniref:Peptide deformylase n=1 Tax=Fertoeibacter niger TaxID=2656921 RepID=A0A8X8H3G3_9RHOB|nr:peptide deformylase [Fertoeibacter niger]NUB46646.1 peptide deformylase [Fertoeibacter niger]